MSNLLRNDTIRFLIEGVIYMRFYVIVVCVLFSAFSCCSKAKQEAVSYEHPFSYDLHLTQFMRSPREAIICFHGAGGDYKIMNHVHEYAKTDATVIGFNFPDHNLRIGFFDPQKTHFGTIEEILPVLYILKKVVIDQGFKEISLYGFSAGGGAVINTLATLNTSLNDDDLNAIGIGRKEKKKILAAVQKGKILLDAPLKSLGEVVDFHAKHQEKTGLGCVGARYKANNMEPIDNIEKLKGLSLHLIVNFQNPDEILSNRDDILYIERLSKFVSKGSLHIVNKESGHSLPHKSLWECYEQTCSR